MFILRKIFQKSCAVMKIIVTLYRQKEQEVLTRHSVNRLF